MHERNDPMNSLSNESINFNQPMLRLFLVLTPEKDEQSVELADIQWSVYRFAFVDTYIHIVSIKFEILRLRFDWRMRLLVMSENSRISICMCVHLCVCENAENFIA